MFSVSYDSGYFFIHVAGCNIRVYFVTCILWSHLLASYDGYKQALENRNRLDNWGSAEYL